jgi:hypothetical protein
MLIKWWNDTNFGYLELNKIWLKLTLLISFYLFNVATRKFQFAYKVHILLQVCLDVKLNKAVTASVFVENF